MAGALRISREALAALAINRQRSGLMMLGILIGVASLAVVIAIGLSAAELAAVKITGLPLAVAAGVCTLITQIFGVYQALKAASTDPVRALQGAAS